MDKITGYYTLRRDVMALADELNVKRREMLEMIGQMNASIATLVEFSDHIFDEATKEMSPDGEYRGPEGARKAQINITKFPVVNFATKDPSPSDIADAVNPGRRTCSHCEEPGHNKRTCPKLHLPSAKTQKELKAGVGVVKKKRSMKPLTPERKAQLGESLKKARVARAKKGAKK